MIGIISYWMIKILALRIRPLHPQQLDRKRTNFELLRKRHQTWPTPSSPDQHTYTSTQRVTILSLIIPPHPKQKNQNSEAGKVKNRVENSTCRGGNIFFLSNGTRSPEGRKTASPYLTPLPPTNRRPLYRNRPYDALKTRYSSLTPPNGITKARSALIPAARYS